MSSSKMNNYPQAEAVPVSQTAYTTAYMDSNPSFIPNASIMPPSSSRDNQQPLLSRNYSSNYTLTPNEQTTKAFLSQREWPIGLQNLLLKNIVRVPYRFFICDDSGSMSTNDGNRLLGHGNKTAVVQCSRWLEMTESLKFHAALAHALNMPSEFRLLNGAAPILIGGPDAIPDGVSILETIFDDSPGGMTPLCRHIQEVTERIQELEPSLRSLGQRACIVIMTDGEASDGDLATGT